MESFVREATSVATRDAIVATTMTTAWVASHPRGGALDDATCDAISAATWAAISDATLATWTAAGSAVEEAGAANG